jgi:hypothetical protein
MRRVNMIFFWICGVAQTLRRLDIIERGLEKYDLLRIIEKKVGKAKESTLRFDKREREREVLYFRFTIKYSTMNRTEIPDERIPFEQVIKKLSDAFKD